MLRITSFASTVTKRSHAANLSSRKGFATIVNANLTRAELLEENLRTPAKIIEDCEREIAAGKDTTPGEVSDRGKMMVRYTNNEGKKRLQHAASREVLNAGRIVVGGNDTGYGIALSGVMSVFEQFLGSDATPAIGFHHEQGAIASDRDSAIWNNNKRAISPEIQRFTDNYLLPRILRGIPTAFNTFGSGAKKVRQARTAAEIALANQGFSQKEIGQHLQLLTMLSISHHPDYNNLQCPGLGTAVSMVLLEDLAARPTFDIYANILIDENVHKRPYSLYSVPHPDYPLEPASEHFIVLGPGKARPVMAGKINERAHRPDSCLEVAAAVLPEKLHRLLTRLAAGTSHPEIKEEITESFKEHGAENYNPRNIRPVTSRLEREYLEAISPFYDAQKLQQQSPQR